MNLKERRQQAKQNAQKRELEDQLTDKAQTHLQKAREAEKQADPSKMSAENRAMYHYLQAVTTVLEQDYDILLDSQS